MAKRTKKDIVKITEIKSNKNIFRICNRRFKQKSHINIQGKFMK